MALSVPILFDCFRVILWPCCHLYKPALERDDTEARLAANPNTISPLYNYTNMTSASAQFQALVTHLQWR